jgi:hypothetical protein
MQRRFVPVKVQVHIDPIGAGVRVDILDRNHKKIDFHPADLGGGLCLCLGEGGGLGGGWDQQQEREAEKL